MNTNILFRWDLGTVPPKSGPVDGHNNTVATFDVTGDVSPYYPARIGGPPENCSPAEGGEVEIEKIKLVELEIDGEPVAEITAEMRAEWEARLNAEIDEADAVWSRLDNAMFEAAQGDRWWR